MPNVNKIGHFGIHPLQGQILKGRQKILLPKIPFLSLGKAEMLREFLKQEVICKY